MSFALARNEQIRLDLIESDQERISHSDPYTSYIRDAIREAQRIGASDIHLEPNDVGMKVRMRVHGSLFNYRNPLSKDVREMVIRKIKQLARVSVAVSNKPQDGRMFFPQWNLNIRANIAPSNGSEKACLRLLDQSKEFSLDQMGLADQCLSDIRHALKQSNGLVLISGPTGSGKSTTLYSMLCELDREKLNIVTLEDPIEYQISGINQTQVGSHLSFDEGLRAFMRQDPNVILVGEVRDEETAQLCFRAASTGHLVLSTVHANSAVEVITRLVSLNVNPHLIKSNVRFSGAQRLFGKLCPHCSVLYDGQMDLFPSLEGPNFRTIPKNHSCTQCVDGMIGRIPLVEYVTGKEIQEHLDGHAPQTTRPTLRSLALAHAARGEIDTEVALRVS